MPFPKLDIIQKLVFSTVASLLIAVCFVALIFNIRSLIEHSFHAQPSTVLAAPAGPSVKASTSGPHDVTLIFNPGSDATSTTTYSVFRATTSGAEGTVPILTGQDVGCTTSPCPTITDSTANVVGTTYYYTVTAVTNSAQSPQSAESNGAQILPYAPTIGTATGH